MICNAWHFHQLTGVRRQRINSSMEKRVIVRTATKEDSSVLLE
ncbi:GNAT family N-acetyltransferase, partial [Vibrio cyclitrophicus]